MSTLDILRQRESLISSQLFCAINALVIKVLTKPLDFACANLVLPLPVNSEAVSMSVNQSSSCEEFCPFQVLFSSHHLGRITKGCSNNYDSESLLLYLHLLTLTQLYSNLVYNEHDTTYLCLVLVVLVSPKISGVRLALLCTLLFSIIFVWSASSSSSSSCIA